MRPIARNAFASIAAVTAAYLVLAIAATIDSAIGYPRSYSGAAGEVLLRLSTLWPFVLASAVLGTVAAFIAGHSSRQAWPFIVAVLAIGLYAASQRYIAPEAHEWLMTILAAAIVGAAAACSFWLIARRREQTPRSD